MRHLTILVVLGAVLGAALGGLYDAPEQRVCTPVFDRQTVAIASCHCHALQSSFRLTEGLVRVISNPFSLANTK